MKNTLRILLIGFIALVLYADNANHRGIAENITLLLVYAFALITMLVPFVWPFVALMGLRVFMKSSDTHPHNNSHSHHYHHYTGPRAPRSPRSHHNYSPRHTAPQTNPWNHRPSTMKVINPK